MPRSLHTLKSVPLAVGAVSLLALLTFRSARPAPCGLCHGAEVSPVSMRSMKHGASLAAVCRPGHRLGDSHTPLFPGC